MSLNYRYGKYLHKGVQVTGHYRNRGKLPVPSLLVRDVDYDLPIDRFSGGGQNIAVALSIALPRCLTGLHQVHESTFFFFDEIFGSQDEEQRSNLLTAPCTQESRFPRILLISPIAEIPGESANPLVVEMGPDNARRVREAG